MDRFFIITKDDEGKLYDFVGPVLSNNIDRILAEEFEKDENPIPLDETIFKSLYFDEYVNDFKYNWSYYISVFLDSLSINHEIVCFKQKENIEIEYEVNNDAILINDLGCICFNNNKLQLDITLYANPVDVAQLVLGLSKYIIFCELTIGEKCYITENGDEFLGHDADAAFNVEKIFTFNLN